MQVWPEIAPPTCTLGYFRATNLSVCVYLIPSSCCQLQVQIAALAVNLLPYQLQQEYIIGASLSEPHINGTAMREFYIIIIIIIMVRRSRACH